MRVARKFLMRLLGREGENGRDKRWDKVGLTVRITMPKDLDYLRLNPAFHDVNITKDPIPLCLGSHAVKRMIKAIEAGGCRVSIGPPELLLKLCRQKVHKAEVLLEILNFETSMTTGDALRRIKKMGFRPASFHELLALCQTFPMIKEYARVASLSPVGEYDGVPLHAYLGKFFDESSLFLENFHMTEITWAYNTCFPVVRLPKNRPGAISLAEPLGGALSIADNKQGALSEFEKQSINSTEPA